MERGCSATPGMDMSDSDTEQEQPERCWPRLRKHMRSAKKLLMNAPWVWVIPLMLFVALAVVCEVAIYVAAQNKMDIRRAQAANVLKSKLSGIDSELLSMQGPIAALSSVIEQDPNMQRISKKFPQVSDHIVKVRSTRGAPAQPVVQNGTRPLCMRLTAVQAAGLLCACMQWGKYAWACTLPVCLAGSVG
uniref:Uncharacterized protein n=1 Tax=Chlamydomonas euryale TaxID=1486919 RepID=A0A7R9Z121_9CHLO|mmetsp:Transcript_38185/g.113150  ORF Transcript_38185/g.113150 Transcript_38185/m.113150 type:complete len:190 (+) Transcript_38185:332-901(+)